MNAPEVTTTEIMEFLQEHTATKEDLAILEKRMATKEDLAKLKHELLDSMDDKLADLKGDLIVLMRKEDRKVVELINLLFGKRIISDEEARSLLAMEPFPQ